MTRVCRSDQGSMGSAGGARCGCARVRLKFYRPDCLCGSAGSMSPGMSADGGSATEGYSRDRLRRRNRGLQKCFGCFLTQDFRGKSHWRIIGVGAEFSSTIVSFPRHSYFGLREVERSTILIMSFHIPPPRLRWKKSSVKVCARTIHCMH
ncbi:uncharacterized protein EI90DRAFT_2689445 [Cantharellus anzutake]|uniref:uncharacterized protein n=1 Tax=Cantharellus anzutake TaxID=1750568 RepID=UPI001906F854|nr:uncharacterized protein EI90DRAFT_2689445 [Cantharellus anzutake]KAF8318919.1 hypothetical protein EI90DRAFT_2689445 [Cantharellus anzutake]